MNESNDSLINYSDKDDLLSIASEIKSLEDSLENLNFKNSELDEERTPIMTQFKTILFSQHENSVKVIKEHQYLLNTILLMKEQILNENNKIKKELNKLIRTDPNKLTFVYNCLGKFLIKKSSHLIRKEYEIRLLINLRKLKCLNSKLVHLELVVLEEKTRANLRKTEKNLN